MARRDHYKGTSVNIVKIFKALREAARDGEGYLTVSELARRGRMHKWTVSRTVDLYMHNILEIVKPDELEAIGLQAKLVKLKDPNMSLEQLVNYLKLRRKLKP